MLARMWRKGKSLKLLVGMQTGAATLENSTEVPQKVKNRTALRCLGGAVVKRLPLAQGVILALWD